MPELTPEIERELAAIDDALAGRRVESELTELGELALALREERPRPGPEFGAELDAKVERGFRDPDPRSAVSGRRWWEALLTVPAFGTAFAVLLVVTVVAIGPSGSDDEESAGGGGSATMAQPESAGGGDSESEDSASATEESAGGAGEGVTPMSGGSAGAAQRSGAEPAPAAADSAADFAEPVPPGGGIAPYPGPGSPRADGRPRRSIERSAALTLAARPRDIDAVSARIQDVTHAQGGFVVSSTVSSSTDGGGGEFVVRVPTRNLDAAVAALSRLGSVRERSQRAQDITPERVSARSRLTDARTERKSLLSQLAEADTPAETESIRRRLDIVSREIERARAAVRRVANRAAFSTVAITLIADRDAGSGPAEDDNWTPGDAARDAVRVLEVAAGVALIVLAIALPLALLAAPAALAARWSRRRRREHALDTV
jgi:Domain of unknown function (DUF4349)